MKSTIWKQLEKVNIYLEKRKTQGIEAFIKLIQQANTDAATLIVLTFTHENVEAYAKVNGQFQLYNHLAGVLSQAEIEELIHYEYDDTDSFQDYQFWKVSDLSWELIELWIVDCFREANKQEKPNSTDYYFKFNHDSMKALRLNDCQRKLEQSEFETYVKNSQHNLIKLLRE